MRSTKKKILSALSILVQSRGKKRFYHFVSPPELFRISNYPFSYNHLCFAPRTWIKTQWGAEWVRERERGNAALIQITYTYTHSDSSPLPSCCAVSVWIKPSCRGITSGARRAAQSHSRRGVETGREEWFCFVVEIRETGKSRLRPQWTLAKFKLKIHATIFAKKNLYGWCCLQKRNIFWQVSVFTTCSTPLSYFSSTQ